MNPIDRIIKEKLEGLEAPFKADSWQLMEQRLDEEAMGTAGEGQQVADTKHFDEAVFEKLHRYRPAYQPGNWRRMEALLEEAFTWPRKVLRYKLIELTLMLLLFLFLWQYAPRGPVAGSTGPQALENTLDDTPSSLELPPSRPEASKAPPSGQSAASQDDGALPPASAAGSKGGAAAAGAGTARPDEPVSGQNIAIAEKNNEQVPSLFALPPAPVGQRQPALEVPPRPLTARLSLYPAFMAELSRLDVLPPELVYDGGQEVGEVSFTKNKTGLAFRVGMFGSAEYNHITVPSSEEKKLEEELQRYAMGYGGGLSLGLETGRFEIETGAIYAARQYPVGLVYVSGTVGSGLQGRRLEASELNIINVPLHVRYSFLRRGGWRAYALAGASLQVAFQRNYYVTEEPTYDFLPMQPPPPPPPGEEPVIDRIRKSGLGWFEGGTFEENAYLTGNLGIGLERYINPRWSLFVQPTYQHSLQYFRVGLGPNADRINSLSVLFGAKVRLK